MQNNNKTRRFLVASIIPHNLSEKESFENIKELIFLVESYGGKVEEIVLQKREVHDKGMYLGSGKIDEISELIKDKKINVVVLNAIIVPGQIYDMVTTFQKINPEIEVWDRVDLILKIFSKRAFTAEAKLQIELAAMRHMGPRIYGMGLEMSRQGGGIGTRGIGETNTERMKRHWRDEIKRTKERLSKILKVREEQMKKRKEIPLKTVSLVGYTNAGKTSLFNLLTKKKKEAKDELFATLESYTGKMYMPSLKQEVLISDTIGFIRDLPPELIDAFRSTLLESINADLLIHVIDISDQDMQRKIDVVNGTLKELGAEQKKMVYVYNKTDLIKEKIELQKNSVAISVHKKTGVLNLMGMIEYSL
jgi:GTP-binding protein HflX